MDERSISRVTRAPARAQRHYNRLSKWYGALIEPTERAPRMLALSQLSPAPGERILEIGFSKLLNSAKILQFNLFRIADRFHFAKSLNGIEHLLMLFGRVRCLTAAS